MILIAKVKVKEGQGETLEKAFEGIIPQVEKEEGTLAYTLAKSMSDPNEYVVYEKYKDENALTHHSSTPYLLELFGVLESVLDGPPELPMYEEIVSIKR